MCSKPAYRNNKIHCKKQEARPSAAEKATLLSIALEDQTEILDSNRKLMLLVWLSIALLMIALASYFIL